MIKNKYIKTVKFSSNIYIFHKIFIFSKSFKDYIIIYYISFSAIYIYIYIFHIKFTS